MSLSVSPALPPALAALRSPAAPAPPSEDPAPASTPATSTAASTPPAASAGVTAETPGPGDAPTVPDPRAARPRAKSLPPLRGVLHHPSHAHDHAHAHAHDPHAEHGSKAVHFGPQLTDVRVFKPKGRPTSVNRPPGARSDTETETEEEDPSDLEGLRLGLSLSRALLGVSMRSRPRSGPAPAPGAGAGTGFSLPPSLLRPLMARKRVQPFTLGLQLGQAVRDRSSAVLLEGVRLASDARHLEGYVRVQNLAFDKWVAVRYTFDHWASASEVSAHWVMSLPPHPGKLVWSTPAPTPMPTSPLAPTLAQTAQQPHTQADLPGTAVDTTPPHLTQQEQVPYSGDWDRFHFTLRLGETAFVWAPSERSSKKIEMAVHYVAAGGDYWDNNGGVNFTFDLVRRPLELPQEALPRQA